MTNDMEDIMTPSKSMDKAGDQHLPSVTAQPNAPRDDPVLQSTIAAERRQYNAELAHFMEHARSRYPNLFACPPPGHDGKPKNEATEPDDALGSSPSKKTCSEKSEEETEVKTKGETGPETGQGTKKELEAEPNQKPVEQLQYNVVTASCEREYYIKLDTFNTVTSNNWHRPLIYVNVPELLDQSWGSEIVTNEARRYETIKATAQTYYTPIGDIHGRYFCGIYAVIGSIRRQASNLFPGRSPPAVTDAVYLLNLPELRLRLLSSIDEELRESYGNLHKGYFEIHVLAILTEMLGHMFNVPLRLGLIQRVAPEPIPFSPQGAQTVYIYNDNADRTPGFMNHYEQMEVIYDKDIPSA